MTDAYRVTIRTTHDRPSVIADAIAPDNTDEVSTRVSTDDGEAGGAVVTTITRDGIGGLRATADDYVSNLTVAQKTTDTTTRS